MTRSSLVLAFVVLVVALCAGLLPAPATAAAAPRPALDALATGPGADALLSADAGVPLSGPAPRTCAAGASLAVAAPRPAARIAPPSPVRTAHRVDGLSLPLLR